MSLQETCKVSAVALAANVVAAWRQAGGIGEVWTRANDAVTCSL